MNSSRRTKKSIKMHYKTNDGEEIDTESQISDLITEFCKIKIGNLKELSFTDCILEPEEMNFIIPFIAPTLSVLDVSNLGLTPKSMKLLSKKIQNVALTKLNLSNNPICDESIWMILEVIGKKETFKELNIENCNLTADGIFPVLNCLTTREFTELNISGNNIGFNGAGYIRNYFSYAPKIHKFIARNCGFSSADIDLIVPSFIKVPNTEVDLTSNQPIPTKKLPPNIKVEMHSMV